MAVSAKFREHVPGSKWTTRIFELIFSNTPTGYVANGDPLNLQPNSITNTAIDSLGGARMFAAMPDLEYELNSSGGFWFELVRGIGAGFTVNSLNGYLVKVWTASAAEHAAGAYEAAFLAPTSPFLIAANWKTLK